MAPTGALLLAVSALIALGVLAAWLINIPLWAIGAGAAGGALLVWRLFRSFSRRARQETETGP